MSPTSPIRRALAATLGSGLLLAACGATGPTPAPTIAPTTAATVAPTTVPTAAETARPAAEVYAEIRAQVEAIRGLSPTAAVEPVLIDEAQLRKNLEAEFDAAQTPKQLVDSEDMLIALGLLPKGASLRQLTLDFQAGQVAGYYSPDKDQLFVVQRSEGVGAVAESTYAHEFTHQLQDQHVDLDALGTADTDQSDRSLARLALVEGDATSVQTTWMIQNLDAKQMGEIMAAALDPAAVAALEHAPAFLRETAVFPYQDGFAFVSRLLSSGRYPAVDAAFSSPPDSTEQVIHPDKYVAREAPINVTLPDGLAASLGSGWSVATTDTLGELILRIWLVQGGLTQASARAAAAGWGGDRLALLRGPNAAAALVLRTAWDTPADADEFFAAAQQAKTGLNLDASLEHAAGSTVVTLAIGDASAKLVGALAK